MRRSTQEWLTTAVLLNFKYDLSLLWLIYRLGAKAASHIGVLLFLRQPPLCRIPRGKKNFWVQNLSILPKQRQQCCDFTKETRKMTLLHGWSLPSGSNYLTGKI
jgi:hypothetical protein